MEKKIRPLEQELSCRRLAYDLFVSFIATGKKSIGWNISDEAKPYRYKGAIDAQGCCKAILAEYMLELFSTSHGHYYDYDHCMDVRPIWSKQDE